MTKETLLILIEKEIAELATLTKGFAQLKSFPQPLLELSLQKAQNLKDSIEKLALLSPENEQAEPVCEPETPAPCDTEILPEVKEEQIEEIEEVEKIEEAVIRENEPEIAENEPIEEISPIENEPIEALKVGQKTILAETITQKTSVLENFANDESRVATAISHAKIENLKTALSIGDRFRFQRELFGGNGELMSTALNEFNTFSNLEEAKNYIAKNFKWDETDKNVADFLDLLQRRYL